LGKTRNYKLLFKDKIVFTKCVVTFEGEKYYGIFINNKFHGFHHESFVDLFIETDIILETKIDNLKLYKISNLTQVFEKNNLNNNARLVGIVPQHNIGKLKFKNIKTPYWINLKELNEKIKLNSQEYSKEKVILDDIFEFIKIERNKSKLIADQVLEVKKYIKTKLN